VPGEVAARLAGLVGPGGGDGGEGGAPVEVPPVQVTLPPPPTAGGTGGPHGHALAGVLAGVGPLLSPDLLVVRHAGYDLVEADGGAGAEAAWVVVGSESE